METRRIIRSFPSHKNEITDLIFSPDGKWLIVATSDRSIRTWDLPRSKLIDLFLVKKACTSLDMSPTGEFLLTSHFDDLGIYLWSNVTLTAPMTLKPIDTDAEGKEIEFPHVRPDEADLAGADSFIVEDFSKDKEMENQSTEYKSREKIQEDLITLSLQPASRWKNLLSIDLIKVSK